MFDKLKEVNDELDKVEKNYLYTRREYDEQEFEILSTFDFKGNYGKDNDKIRKGHVKEELADLLSYKDELYLQYESLKREAKYLELLIEHG